MEAMSAVAYSAPIIVTGKDVACSGQPYAADPERRQDRVSHGKCAPSLRAAHGTVAESPLAFA
jgi:hypothetical protein